MAKLDELKASYLAAGERLSKILDDARGRARTPGEFETCGDLHAEMDGLRDQMRAEGMSEAAIEEFRESELRGDGEPTQATAPATAREANRDCMRRTMASMGIMSPADPGAGLPPAQAGMARELARAGLNPCLPAR